MFDHLHLKLEISLRKKWILSTFPLFFMLHRHETFFFFQKWKIFSFCSGFFLLVKIYFFFFSKLLLGFKPALTSPHLLVNSVAAGLLSPLMQNQHHSLRFWCAAYNFTFSVIITQRSGLRFKLNLSSCTCCADLSWNSWWTSQTFTKQLCLPPVYLFFACFNKRRDIL